MKKVKHSLNILVVDDMEINRSLLKSMLEKMCFQVDEAAGGQEAIMMCQSSMYDLILVDINMPGMNGDQVARKLRDDLPYETVIIGVSAQNMDGDISRCHALGFDDFILKPVTMNRLKNIVGEKFALLNGEHESMSVSNYYTEDFFPLNESSISELARDFGNQITYFKYVDKFIDQNNCIWLELNSDFSVKNFDSIMANFHKLSGIAASIGASDYADILNDAYKTLHKEDEISNEEFIVLQNLGKEVERSFNKIKLKWKEREYL